MRVCSFPGCGRPFDAKDLCSGHNKQRYEGKELRPLIFKKRQILEWSLETLLEGTDQVGECMVRCRPYSKVRYKGKHVQAHRLSYELSTGEDIKGVQIHHTCADARCINPKHLQRASAAENMLEMLARRDYEAEIARLQLRIVELEAQLEGANLG